jgi:HK97 family phage major capsid protein
MGSLFSIKNTLASERAEAVRLANEFMALAEKEERELTDEERGKVKAHLAKAEELNSRIIALQGDEELRARMAQFQTQENDRQQSRAITDGEERGRRRILSLGEQFVGSDLYKNAIANRNRNSRGWTSGQIELEGGIRAATLTTDGASGGDLIVPNYQSGITQILFQRLTVSDLLASGTTDGPTIYYMKETTAANAAATVAEGAAKPESTLVFDAVTDSLKKIATWLPVSDEMLDDVPQIRSYIDQRLRFFVEQQEEAQLLNGDGTGTNLTGLRNRTGLATDVARGTDSNADAIFKQMMAIMTTAFVMPDAVVVHPTNWQAIALSKDSNGAYLGNGPFNSPLVPRLWGLPVVVTTAITANVALVGAYKMGAQVFRKGGISVDVSNSHSDYFIKNLTAIRAEERVALAVYRPGAFGEVTGLN